MMKYVNSSCVVCSKKFNACLANDENINRTTVCNNFSVFCQHLYPSFYHRRQDEKKEDKLLLDFYYDSFSFCKACEKLVINLVKLQKKVDNNVKSLFIRVIKKARDSRGKKEDDFRRQKLLVEQILTDRITQIEEDISKYYNPQVTLTKITAANNLLVDDVDKEDCNVDPLFLPDDDDDGDDTVSHGLKAESPENVDIPSTKNSFPVNDDDYYSENSDEQKNDSGAEDLVYEEYCQVKEESEECDDGDDDYKPEDESKSLGTRSRSNNNNNNRRKQKFETFSTVPDSVVIPANRGRKRGRPPTKQSNERKSKIVKSTPKNPKKVPAAKNVSSEEETEDDQDEDDDNNKDVGNEVDDKKDKDWNDKDLIEAEFYKSRHRKRDNSSAVRCQQFPTVTIEPGVYRYGEWEFRDVGNNLFKCQCGYGMRGRFNIYRHLNAAHVFQIERKGITRDEQGLLHYEDYTIEETEDGFKCGVCDRTNKNKYSIIQHINKIHNPNRPRCVDCGAHFMTKERLKDHKCKGPKLYPRRLKFVHLEGDNYLYDGKWKYQKVTTTLADGTCGVSAYKCGTCGVEKKKLNNLIAHIRYTHRDPHKYVCEVCGYSTPVMGPLKQHMAIHLNQHDFICDVCGKTCISRSRLVAHKIKHRTEQFKCTKCDRSFQYYYGLSRHCQTTGHHPDKPKPQAVAEDQCPQCGQVFGFTGSLDKHMKKCRGAITLPLLVQKRLEIIVQNNINKDHDDEDDGDDTGEKEEEEAIFTEGTQNDN